MSHTRTDPCRSPQHEQLDVAWLIRAVVTPADEAVRRIGSSQELLPVLTPLSEDPDTRGSGSPLAGQSKGKGAPAAQPKAKKKGRR